MFYLSKNAGRWGFPLIWVLQQKRSSKENHQVKIITLPSPQGEFLSTLSKGETIKQIL